MSPHLGEQLQERIIIWRFQERKTVAEIARLAGCTERNIYKILKLHRDFGHTRHPFARRPGRPRTLNQQDLAFVSSLLDANPSLFLDELQECLIESQDVEISIATLSRTLRRLALTHKHASKAASERDELLRATWLAEYGHFPKEYFVWIDESSIDNRTNQRPNGWAPFGRACVRRMSFICGQRFSILPALSVDGIIALDIFEGAVNKEKFIKFLHEQVVS